MGSFSVWHLLIFVIIFLVPVFFIFRKAPAGPNRFGSLPVAMNFGQAIGNFFVNYASFSGRASRSEFWYSMLFIFVVTVVLNLVDPTEIMSAAFSLGILIPTLAVAARRLHDINRSGWHQILSWFFPIGTIALLVWYCKPAADGDATPLVKEKSHATMSSIEVLEKLAKLKDSGAISPEEFEAEKRKILGR